MSERLRFSERSVAAIVPRAQRSVVWDERFRGLGVRVTPAGAKSYVVVYRFDGAPRMHTIGDVRGVTIAEAIEAYGKAITSIARAKVARQRGETPPDELDPAAAKRQARKAMHVAETVADVWKAFTAKRRPEWRPKTAAENDRMWTAYLQPLAPRRARDVRPRDIKALLDGVAKTGPVQANRVRALVSAVFRFAADQFIVDANPVKEVRRVSKETARSRAMLEEAELRGFLAAMTAPDWPDAVRRAILMTLATGCRPGEAMSMQWTHVDEAFRTWVIPAEIAKCGLEHVVPLSPFALQILAESRAAGAVGAFPLADVPGTEQLARDALSSAILDRHPLLAEHSVAPLRPHDLRRTCRSWLSKLGVPKNIAERCIGHVEKDPIVKTYDRYQYLPEKREAFETWGAMLEALSKPAA